MVDKLRMLRANSPENPHFSRGKSREKHDDISASHRKSIAREKVNIIDESEEVMNDERRNIAYHSNRSTISKQKEEKKGVFNDSSSFNKNNLSPPVS